MAQLVDVSVAHMVSNTGEWRWEVLEPMLPLDILLRIAAIKCPVPCFPADSVGWNGSTSGRFTLKSAYHIRHGVEEGPDENIWKIITKFKGFKERRRSTLEHARDWLNTVVTASSMGSLPLQRIVGTRHLSTEVWSPLSLGWVKINVDAA
ncbi:hypothetical protein V6N12_040895 [Hibiscus sabdariffa]|uniref:Uncharacterized protein n=1 Tax=Hibiscus sabdariffa TaxID=183260 RepID=A0ABR2E512_9ROSI